LSEWNESDTPTPDETPVGGFHQGRRVVLLSFRDHVLVAILTKLGIAHESSIQLVALLRDLNMYQPSLADFHDALDGLESVTPQTLSRLRSQLVDQIASEESVWAATWQRYPQLHPPKLPRAALKNLIALREADDRKGDKEYTTLQAVAKSSRFGVQARVVATMPYDDWYRLWFALGCPSLKEKSE